MEEQAVQTWQLFGAAIGAAVASFLSTWATLIRPMKRQVEEAKEVPVERLSLIEAEQKRQNERLKKVEEKSDKSLTKEEFAAYASNTTQALNIMTEKVGVITGTIQGIRNRG